MTLSLILYIYESLCMYTKAIEAINMCHLLPHVVYTILRSDDIIAPVDTFPSHVTGRSNSL